MGISRVLQLFFLSNNNCSWSHISLLWSIVPPFNLRTFFSSIHIHDFDFIVQGNVRAAQIPIISTSLLEQLTAILYVCDSYLQSFVALRHWSTPGDVSNPFQMVIHSDRRPSAQHVDRYNGPQASEIASIIPELNMVSLVDRMLSSVAREI